MANSWTPAKSAFSRVFLIDGRARADHEPDFQSCLRAGGLDQAFGDIEPIQCPDPERYGDFIEVGAIQGAIDRATMDLVGRYASDMASTLLEIAKRRCSVDIQLHFGACTDPRAFDVFTKNIILEDVYLTNWSTDELGALSSDENSPVNETTPLSIREIFEALQLTFQERGGDLVDNEGVDVVICDQASCGECEDESTGCEKIYVLAGGITGSPGTPPDIIYSLDKGQTWAIDEVTSLLFSEAASALACIEDWMVVVSQDSCSLHYKSKSDLDDGVAAGWVEVATGFVATGCPNDIWSVGTAAFVVGEDGYVYYLTEPSAGVTVLDAGVVTTEDLRAVHAISDEFAVAVGENDTIIWTQNRVNWSATTSVTGGGNDLQGVWVKNENEWFVVDDGGQAWYTIDQGQNWVEMTLPGNVTELHDIAFASDSVGYICGRYGENVRAWRTFNSGQSWVALPEGLGNLPNGDDLNALAACSDDINFVVLVGEGETANDGIIIVGED